MSTPERRQIPRTTLERLAYLQIEPDNGGIVLNVSNDGLCFHSIAAVEKNGPLRFSLLEKNRRITACGELAWTDEIQKVGGVRFITLTAEAREQIQNWITQPAVPLEEHTSTLGSAILKAFPRFRLFRLDPSRDSPGSSVFATTLPRMRLRIKLSGFARGLATGLLLSLLCASAFILYAQRRDIGESLIHLGERLAGERLAGERLAAEHLPAALPVANPETEKQPVPPPSLAVSSASKPSSPVRRQTSVSAQSIVNAEKTPAHRETPPLSQIPVRKQASAVHQKNLFAQTLPIPAKQQNATLKPVASGNAASRAPKDPVPQSPAPRTAETVATSLPATSPGVPSSPAANIVANSPSTPPQPEPAGPVQVTGLSGTNAISLPQMFFELGKFKDEQRARDLGDRVSQLGMHPSVVQKGHLWMNAFYVLVGPYGNPEEAARTHKDLLSHGYNPRPFERGSRSFTFISGLTLAGATLPVGDFTINWESYVTDAKVKFAQGNNVLATASGQWVKRPARYQRDEYVYVKSGNGSRLLREIHFSGLDRALVFRDSS
jgi:hypothetical protein